MGVGMVSGAGSNLAGSAQQQMFLGDFSACTVKGRLRGTDVPVAFVFWGYVPPHDTKTSHPVEENSTSVTKRPFPLELCRGDLDLVSSYNGVTGLGSGLPLLTTMKLDGMDEVIIVRLWTKSKMASRFRKGGLWGEHHSHSSSWREVNVLLQDVWRPGRAL